MDKKDKASVCQSQMEDKPRIGDLIDAHLVNDLNADSQDFVGFVTSLKMTPQWYAAGSFSVNHKGKRVCIIKVHDGSWWIWSYTRYNNEFESCLANGSAGLRDTILNNMIQCYGCGGCAPGEDAMISGRNYSGLCRMPVIRFQNPNRDELEFAKKLVMLRRRAISNNEVPRVSYIAMSKRNNG